MKAIIVDDEPQSHEVLKKLLANGHPDVQIAGSAYNVAEGLYLLQKHDPDLVFLDIEMPGGSGFDLLEQVGVPDFYVVFITAHNQYAVSAIRSGALDYLLKPVTSETLGQAMDKVRSKYQEKLSIEQWKVAFEAFQLAKQQKLPSRMTISTLEGIHFIPVEEVVRFEASGAQTEVFTLGARKRLIASINIGEYAEYFEPYPTFMKVHRSHLVNLLFIDKFVRSGSHLVMKDGAEIPVARASKDELLRRLESL